MKPERERRGVEPSARAAAAALVLLGLAAAVAAPPLGAAPSPAAEQMTFGTRMAQRGLWSEALFRFRQATQLDPGNPRALSNLAVAYEALGRFEEAQATYERALALAAGADVKRNQTRFAEFYQGFKGRAQPAAKPAAQELAPAPPAAPPPASPPGVRR